MMPARLWNIMMILLIGPFAYFAWKSGGGHNSSAPSQTGAT
jgi:hypothetical protein